MEQRAIGNLTVSVVGLGTNQLGTSACDEATSAHIVREAIDAGVTYFDTADEYGRNYFDSNDPSGWGRSEEYLGRALGTRRGHARVIADLLKIDSSDETFDAREAAPLK